MAASKVFPKVYVLSKVAGLTESLTALLPKVTFKNIYSGETQLDNLAAELKDAEVLLADPTLVLPIFHNLPNLKWMQATWAGVDSIIDPAKPAPTFKITRLAGHFGPAMAEYVVHQILMHQRQSIESWEDQKNKKWNQQGRMEYRVLSEMTIGVIGVGDIGKEVCKMCKVGFGMNVWGLVRTLPSGENHSPHVDVYKSMTEISEFLNSCDVICSVLPSTNKTKDFLSGDVLKSAQEKCPLFINIGRGDVISEETIFQALRDKWISRAVLDVFSTEPLPSTSPLWTEPGVIITPHVSGITREYMLKDVFVENFNHYVNGEDLKYEVKWEKGY